MQKLFAFLALTASFALAAEPVVNINDTGNTIVDGVNVGAPADAIANNPSLATKIQPALVAFVQAKAADAAAQVAFANAAKDEAIAAHTAAKAAEIDALKAEVAALKAEVAALKDPPAP